MLTIWTFLRTKNKSGCIVLYSIMDYNQRIYLFISIFALSSIVSTGFQGQQYTFGQENQTSASSNGETFRSQFDTFVASEPAGYGMYDEKESNVFAPGETFLLYVEPVGYTYGNITDENGTILAGQEDLPLSNLISHHQNKELMLQMSIDQTSPFPSGDYVLRYTFTDENSGESFDIEKNVTVQG
jgi:hypothetical protein